MRKSEVIWVICTLAVALGAWFVYNSFVKEEPVDAGESPLTEISAFESVDSMASQECDTVTQDVVGLNISELSAVSDEEE